MGHAGETLTRERLIWMYDIMLKSRFFEEKIAGLFAERRLHGTTHLYTGEEACAAGAVAAIGPGDYITSTHRGHGHCIAMGADINRMMAEMMGKSTGSSRGKGGSMHITDLAGGNLGTNGIVAGGVALAAGAALALKMQKRPNVVLCFFGDGARAQGVFHESANMASIWALPVVFVCENNLYAMSTPVHRYIACNDAVTRGSMYSMPGTAVDGNDPEAVYGAVREAVARARAGGGPSYVECATYRWRGHSKSDKNVYRTREEIESWMARDPVRLFKERLIARGVLTGDEAKRIEEAAMASIEDAVRFAEESPEPLEADLETDVYAGRDSRGVSL